MNPEDPAEKLWLDEDAGPVVRPYAVTRGRTRPAGGQFDLISLMVATHSRPPPHLNLGPEHAAIMALCQRPLSVAEVASNLDLPVGIIRVLLGDLLDHGLVLARKPEPTADQPGERVLMAVINGLRSL